MTSAILILLAAAAVAWACAPIPVAVVRHTGVRAALVAALGATGSAACAAAGILAIIARQGDAVTLVLGTWQGLGDASLGIDALSGYFLALTGAVSALLFIARSGTLPVLRGPLTIAALCGLLISLETLFVADNAFFFLAGWEGLSVTFALVVASGYRRNVAAADAAQWTLGMTKLGGAAVLACFLCLAAGTHSFAFASFRDHGGELPTGLADAVLVCAVVGFGVKLAIVPLQSWVPRAYPSAPAGAPAFLAAVALNAGFYGLVRVLSFLGGASGWWGLLILLTGAMTALVGALWAAVQTDLKALISYSSIENVGIILCGIGASVVGTAWHISTLAGLGLVAAFFQIAVHTVAKAGLFVGADAVERHTGTVDMERLGGMARHLPGTAAVFAVVAATIIGLPPLGGFPSEWLTLETLMQGFRVDSLAARVSLAVAGALLALTAAVAGIAFVKAFFATFLGVARRQRPAVPVGRMAIGVGGGGLALMALGLGVAAPWVTLGLGRAAAASAVGDVSSQIATGNLLLEPAFAHFSSIAPTELAIVVPVFAGVLVLLGVLMRNRRVPAVVRTPVWNCGDVPHTARTQYTPTGWSNPTRVVFDSLLRTRRQRTVAGDPLAPAPVVHYRSRVPAPLDEYLVIPIVHATMRLARWSQGLQSGSLAQYLLYVLVVLAAVLLVLPMGR